MKVRSLVFPALAGVIAITILAVPTAAEAEDPAGTFVFSNPTQTVEYGETWSFEFTSNYPSWAADPIVTSVGTPAGWWPGYSTFSSPTYTKSGSIGSFFGVAWLEPGVYSFGISTNSELASGMYATSNTARLTVERAKLGIDLRMIADPSSPENAIVTGVLTGKLVEAAPHGRFSDPPTPNPAGTWTFTIEDSDGTILDERTVSRAAGSNLFATSFNWPDAVAGETYVAKASFELEAVNSGRYELTPAAPFSYTAPDGRVIESPPGQSESPIDRPEGSDFSVPAWWVILIGLALAALVTFVIVFAIRLGRSTSTSKEPS